MKLGVVGLPNVGKSTLFNAITKAGAMSANYPFCTIEPNVGIVPVPDARLDQLEKLYNSKRKVYANIEFVDIAGLVKGASLGEGLGNKFLSHIREVDAIVHCVRCFDDTNIIHVEGKVDPQNDIEIINLELILADIESVDKRLERVAKTVKAGDKDAKEEFEILNIIKDTLSKNLPAHLAPLNDEQKKIAQGFFLLTTKPVIYCANVSEDDLNSPDNAYVQKVKSIAKNENAEVITICAKIEEDLSTLNDDEKNELMRELGIEQSGLDKLITACYHLLGLMSFLTAGEDEVRAWTIPIGYKAPQAAGKIHTDFEKGFIKAEVVNYKDLLELGGFNQAKEKGKVRLEGKDYVVQDGDVMLFKFNV